MKKILLFLFSVASVSVSGQGIDKYFESIRNNTAELTAFISQMPKGGDLHNHYSGAVYAESYINWVIAKDYCINPQTLQVAQPPSSGNCYEGWTKFSTLKQTGELNNLKLKLLRYWSVKDY